MEPFLAIAAAPCQPLVERASEVHLIEDRFRADRMQLRDRTCKIFTRQSALQRIEIGEDRTGMERDAISRDIENFCPARCEQLSKVEQTLPQARFGMRLETAGPQQLAQEIAFDRFVSGKAQHSQQRAGTAVGDRDFTVFGRTELERAKQ
ncbi:MAG: hypothetical protein IE934_02965 [Sphingopyxis sp.]|nr:hypothetical protein [Sphingopyxis sp.]